MSKVDTMTRAFKRMNSRDPRRVKRWLNLAVAVHHEARRKEERQVNGQLFDKPRIMSHRHVRLACRLTRDTGR